MARAGSGSGGDRPARPRRPAASGGDTAELLELIDRLEAIVQGSGIAELEFESGGTAIVLRTPEAVGSPGAAGAAPGGPATAAPARDAPPSAAPAADADTEAGGLHAVLAPLTGVFYLSPTPDAEPYVRVGAQIQAGHVIGLIEAMKLFNEIKSDVSGTVARIAVDSGALVKQKQPLIEVEPA
jgi:acetyl-CoA carboxylase biotin carboxyl carrier protein